MWRPRLFVADWLLASTGSTSIVVLVVLVHWRCHYQILAPALQISHHTLPTGDSAKRTIVLWKCSLRLIIRIKATLDWSRGRWCFLVSAEMTQGPKSQDPKVSLDPPRRYKRAHQMGSHPIHGHYWRQLIAWHKHWPYLSFSIFNNHIWNDQGEGQVDRHLLWKERRASEALQVTMYPLGGHLTLEQSIISTVSMATDAVPAWELERTIQDKALVGIQWQSI